MPSRQALHVAPQAGQFARQADIQAQAVQGLEGGQGLVGIGIAREDPGEIHAGAAKARLGPHEGDLGLAEQKIVRLALHQGHDVGQEEPFAVGIDLLALLQIQPAPGQAAEKAGEHGLHLMEEGTRGPRMGMGQEVIDLEQHLESRTQADLIVGVHGMHGPGLDDAPVQTVEGLHHPTGEFIADLDVGAGDAIDQIEDEVLGVPLQGRQDSHQMADLVESELHVEGRFEPPGEFLAGERRANPHGADPPCQTGARRRAAGAGRPPGGGYPFRRGRRSVR